MSNQFSLKHDEATAEGNHVITTSETINEIIDDLQARMAGLESSMQGQTQIAFQTKMEELRLTELQVLAALTGLGQFLINAANTFAETDRTVSEALMGR